MEMTRDDVYRPASAEPTCTSSRSTVSLSSTPDADTAEHEAETLKNNYQQDRGIPMENTISNPSPDGMDQGHRDAIDKENEEPHIQMAIDEMKRLDLILAAKIRKEKEVGCQRKKFKQNVFQELPIKLESLSACAYEAENTSPFLALGATCGPKEEADFALTFETEVLNQECEDSGQTEQSEKRLGNMQESSDVGQDNGQEQSEGSHSGSPKESKRKQGDFVKKLAGAAGGHALMTQAEKERLAELLREMEEEEEDSAAEADREDDLLTPSAPTAQGYTPEPSSLKRLADIDSCLHPLLPSEEFLSVRSFFTNHCWSQGHSSEEGWEFDKDLQPAQRVLQDVRERKEQEKGLQEIQRQLEIQETMGDSAKLDEEQFLGLLEECELVWSRRQGQGAEDITPWDPDRDATSRGSAVSIAYRCIHHQCQQQAGEPVPC